MGQIWTREDQEREASPNNGRPEKASTDWPCEVEMSMKHFKLLKLKGNHDWSCVCMLYWRKRRLSSSRWCRKDYWRFQRFECSAEVSRRNADIAGSAQTKMRATARLMASSEHLIYAEEVLSRSSSHTLRTTLTSPWGVFEDYERGLAYFFFQKNQ